MTQKEPETGACARDCQSIAATKHIPISLFDMMWRMLSFVVSVFNLIPNINK